MRRRQNLCRRLLTEPGPGASIGRRSDELPSILLPLEALWVSYIAPASG
jgi:hypothetical protein